jgi:hypothetical protein
MGLMLRIVDGLVFEGKRSPVRWRLGFHDLGHGQREVTASRCIEWFESHRLGEDSICAQVLRGEREDPAQAEKDAANARRAARRAKTTMRRRVKSMGCSRLLTLTYKSNQTDEARCKQHVKEFVRRMRTVVPDFAYVAGYETQKRGAWHVHMATHALPVRLPARNGVMVKSWNIVRSIWRSVIGEDGNIDDSAGKLKKRSAAKIAAYLSKYLLKAFEAGADYSKRWTASKHSMPSAQVVEVRSDTLRELFERCFAFVDADGAEFSTWLCPFGDSLYLSSGPPAGL